MDPQEEQEEEVEDWLEDCNKSYMIAKKALEDIAQINLEKESKSTSFEQMKVVVNQIKEQQKKFEGLYKQFQSLSADVQQTIAAEGAAIKSLSNSENT